MEKRDAVRVLPGTRKKILMNYDSRPPVIAHRGGSGAAPENTMAAFKNAVKTGADGIEFDVQRTKDGRLIVIHDADVKRTTNGRGMVRDLTLSQINELDAGIKSGREFSGEHVPALENVLELTARHPIQLIIEIKHPEFYPGIEEQILKAVDAAGIKDRVKIASFDALSLSRVQEIEPSIPLVRNYRFDIPKACDNYYAASVDYRNLRLFPWRISKYRKHCGRLFVWKANTVPGMVFFLKNGIDAIITDYPDRLKKLLDAVFNP